MSNSDDRIVHLVITPGRGQPVPSHPYLLSMKNNKDAYNYYFVPWKPATENEVPDESNFRYGYQAIELWGEENVQVFDLVRR